MTSLQSKKQFAAEVLFLHPDDVPPAAEALAAAGCDFKVIPEAIDPCGPTVFGWITGETELAQDAIGAWLGGIVEPFRGDVVEWGYGSPWPLQP
jgi:hypothetical protein